MIKKRKSNTIIVFIMIVIIFNFLTSYAIPSVSAISKQEIGITITKNKFEGLVTNLTILMKEGTSFKADSDYITLVRVLNTISYCDNPNEKQYQDFINAYAPEYFNLTIEKLKGLPRKGE